MVVDVMEWGLNMEVVLCEIPPISILQQNF